MELRIKFEYEGQKRAILLPQPVDYEQLISKLSQLCGSQFRIEYVAAEGQFIREIESQEDLDDVISLMKNHITNNCLALKLVPHAFLCKRLVSGCPTSLSSVSYLSSPSVVQDDSEGFFKNEVPEPQQVSEFQPCTDYSTHELASTVLRFSSLQCRKTKERNDDYIPESSERLEGCSGSFIPDSLNSKPYREWRSGWQKNTKRSANHGSILAQFSPSSTNQCSLSSDDAFSSGSIDLQPSASEANVASCRPDDLPNISKKSDIVNPPSHEGNTNTIVDQGSSSFMPGKWVKGKLLGQGAFGRVFTGYDIERGFEFAVKEVQIYSQSNEVLQQIDALEMEIAVLQGTHHRHIVEYYGVLREPNCLSIFIEFIPMGSLKDHVNRYGPLTERVTSLYTAQILRGLAYLHRKLIVHRDIKGANILRDHNGNLKLGDFGAAKLLQTQSVAESSKIAGSPYFMAPEIIRGEPCGCRADIWSLGCTVVEMLTKNPPWHKYDCIAAIYRIGSIWPPEYNLPDDTGDKVKNLLGLCFVANPSGRPKAEELLSHPFLLSSNVKSEAS